MIGPGLQSCNLQRLHDITPPRRTDVAVRESTGLAREPRRFRDVVVRRRWITIVANGLIMTVGIMATYLVALDAYAGAFIQERIVGGSNWRDRNKCRVWDGSFFNYETYRDDDDELKECAKYSIRKARTVAFIALVWAENLRAYTARSFTRPIWVNMFANPTMNRAILGAQIALYVALFVPGLSDAVIGLYPLGSPAGRTDGIEWFGWVLALIGALICMTGCELYKCYVKHYAPPPI